MTGEPARRRMPALPGPWLTPGLCGLLARGHKARERPPPRGGDGGTAPPPTMGDRHHDASNEARVGVLNAVLAAASAGGIAIGTSRREGARDLIALVAAAGIASETLLLPARSDLWGTP